MNELGNTPVTDSELSAFLADLMPRQIYFETLACALNAARDNALSDGAVIDQNLWVDTCIAFGPVNYGNVRSLSIPLITLKGKSTKKHLQISLYRIETGKYELTQYFL